jgi:hypothetical protein
LWHRNPSTSFEKPMAAVVESRIVSVQVCGPDAAGLPDESIALLYAVQLSWCTPTPATATLAVALRYVA